MYNDEARSERFYDNPKNHLYKAFLAVVEQTRPKIVLVENVREFLNFGHGRFSTDLITKFNELGYEINFRKLCAADYGIPQIRYRVFFVAFRKDVCDTISRGPAFPTASFSEVGTRDLSNDIQSYLTVRDAIGDLPTPAFGKKDEKVPYTSLRVEREYGRMLRSLSGSVYNHVARPLSQKQIDRINAVGSGRMKFIDPSLRTRSFYGSAYRRLEWDKPSLTITTWVYHVGSGQFAHPCEDRGLTMREAARLQSFDDDFVFPPLINPVSQMIGNAVPPLLASRFGELFSDALDAYYGCARQVAC